MYIYIYIYIYIGHISLSLSMYTYMYIYIYVYTYISRGPKPQGSSKGGLLSLLGARPEVPRQKVRERF